MHSHALLFTLVLETQTHSPQAHRASALYLLSQLPRMSKVFSMNVAKRSKQVLVGYRGHNPQKRVASGEHKKETAAKKLNKVKINQAWWNTPLILALERQADPRVRGQLGLHNEFFQDN